MTSLKSDAFAVTCNSLKTTRWRPRMRGRHLVVFRELHVTAKASDFKLVIFQFVLVADGTVFEHTQQLEPRNGQRFRTGHDHRMRCRSLGLKTVSPLDFIQLAILAFAF